MKQGKRFTIILIVLFSLIMWSCKKENFNLNQIVGKWQLVKGYDLMWGGDYLIDIENQRIEEYTKNQQRILYDYLGNEIARCAYNITDSTIIIYGDNLNSGYWEADYKYWLKQDTLVIHNDGGFEYYNEFLVRIE